MLAQHADDGLDRRQSLAEQPPPGVRILGLERERLQDLLLAPRAEARERAKPLGLRGRPQLVERGNAEVTPDPRRRLRPQARKPHEEHDFGRNRFPPFRQSVDLALLDDLDDLFLDRLPDSLQLLRAAVQREPRNRAGGFAHPGRSAPVREDAKGFGTLQFQQVGEQVELLRDLGIARQNGHFADHTCVCSPD
jgi:hypothetical protein